jgi:hypothetical protein
MRREQHKPKTHAAEQTVDLSSLVSQTAVGYTPYLPRGLTRTIRQQK